MTHAELIRQLDLRSRCTRHSCPSRPSSCGDRDTSRSRARSPEKAAARRRRIHVCAHDGTSTPPRRPLRRRGLPRHLGGRGRPGVGALRAPGAARDDGRLERPRPTVRVGDRVDGRGGRARAQRGRDVPGGRRRRRRARRGRDRAAEGLQRLAAQATTCRWASGSTSRSKRRTSATARSFRPHALTPGSRRVSAPKTRRFPRSFSSCSPRSSSSIPSPRRDRASSHSRAPRPRPRAT